jgi:hypothetical protein
VSSTAPAGTGQRLDNLTLAHKEGWRRFAEASDRVMPEQLTTAQLSALSPAARAVHDRDRRAWHANLGPIRTPQLAALHEDLWDIADSNQQDGDKAKGAVAVDAFPGLGKTTAVLSPGPAPASGAAPAHCRSGAASSRRYRTGARAAYAGARAR